MDDMNIIMALEILRQMSNGKILTLKSGYKLGMAEDGFVGYIIDDKISTFDEITFSNLVHFCKEDDMIIVPK